jgi:polysaccharide biosynthesis transport protein
MPEPSPSALIRNQDATLSSPEATVARRVRTPQPVGHDAHAPGISRNDILFALFKHKKKILLGTIAGLAVAAGVFFFFPRVYESDAVLLVRYLVERGTVDSINTPKNPDGYAPTTDTVIGAEVAILSSWDLAVQSAEAIGPKRLGATTKEEAAANIASGLTLTTTKNSNIISAAYQNRNRELATLVLNELVNRYFSKHLEVHRSAGAFDFVSQQTDQVHARLNQTEDALKDLKSKAGIVSLTDTTAALSTEAAKTEEQLHEAEADLAEQQARVQQMNGSVATANITPEQAPDSAAAEHDATAERGQPEKSESAAPLKQEAPPEVLQKYQVLVSGLQKLRQTQLDLFGKYTPESQMVRLNQTEIDDVEKQRRNLEKKYPDLPARVGPIGSSKQLDPPSEIARLAGLQAKKDALAARLRDVQQRIRQLSQLSPQISDLERQKQMQEDNYKYFETTLEKARVDEALDPSKIPNISAVQRPSPPALVTKTRNKIIAGTAVAGFAIAVGYALLKELVLTGTVRRAVEIEKSVGISALMSIPYRSSRNGPSTSTTSKRNGKLAEVVPSFASRNLAPWDSDHFIRPYSEAIRDRLGLYFELHNLTHKPKLVGVTGLSNAAGTSTLAAGLAAALSTTNDGKVLLVDVSLGPDYVHPFFKGKPAYSLNRALKSDGRIEAAADNLYLATVGSPKAGPAQLGLKKFFDLMPNLKASDFDYIIFDMPTLDQTSPTWGMAPFMDKMLLVVEAEKSTQDAMKRGYRRLVAERDNVAVVLNKVRFYAPKRLELEG